MHGRTKRESLQVEGLAGRSINTCYVYMQHLGTQYVSHNLEGEQTMAGGSHTNFDQQAFTVGAIGGAATIAGALVAGVTNIAAGRRERGVRDALQSRDAVICSLRRRIDNQRTELGRRDATIRDQALTIRELDLRLGMAQYMRQRGR
jgi:hypothetical protein